METMILTGIALLFLFNSLLALLQYLASEEELQAVMFWLFGSLIKTTWEKLGIAAFVLFVTGIDYRPHRSECCRKNNTSEMYCGNT